jgi:adenosine deaminase
MSPAVHPRLEEFLQRIPKTETHLHIEGALPWELIHDLDPERFSEPPMSWQNDYKFSNFAQFETELLDMACAWYTSPERYHEAAGIIFSRLWKEQNVRYVETSFASGMIEFLGLDGKAVCEAIKAAAPNGMTVRVFMGIHHDGYTEGSRGFIEDCLGWDRLDGLDLHGTETVPLESWTADLWKRAREAGKVTKAHAGEFSGAEFIRKVMNELEVRRIQHGVRAVESDSLIEELREASAILDVCPISNVKLDVVDKMENHPIAKLHRAGINCTVSTDDPISFGNTLCEEYRSLHHKLGLTLAELGALAGNGFRNAIGVDGKFSEELKTIDQLVDEFQLEKPL